MTDLEIYNKVFDYSNLKHSGQFRKDGVTPYFYHPMMVSKIVKENGGDIAQQCAALLHDVLEDTDTTIYDLYDFLKTVTLENDFYNIVLDYVLNLTNKYTKEAYPYLNRKERKNHEIAEFATWTDPKLKLIKLADINHNLQGFDSLDADFAKIYIMEELQIIPFLRIESSLYEETKELANSVYKKVYSV